MGVRRDDRRWSARIAELRDLLVSLRRPADDLYAPNFVGDKRPSVTVSAVALQVLSELTDPTADLVYRAIVKAANPNPEAEAPWSAQGGGPPHTVAASWALFAALRHRLDAVHDLAFAANWLMDVQQDGGWPHTRSGSPRPFHTALAVNALLAYRERLDLAGPPERGMAEDLDRAIADGVAFLERSLSHATSELWFWDQMPGGGGICLASSSLSLHVLVKASSVMELRHLRAPALAALRAMAAAITPQALLRVRVTVAGVAVETWPQIVENEPQYWYSYFTPLLAVTFSDALRLSPDAVYLDATRECVRWILDDYEPGANHQSSKGAWGVANALLVLRRASVRETPPLAGSSVLQDVERLAPTIVNEWQEFKIVCEGVDSALLGRITSPAAPETWWSELVTHLQNDLSRRMRLFALLLERYPGTELAYRIETSQRGA